MESLLPFLLISYFEAYRSSLSKPNFGYFQGFVVALLISHGKRTVTTIAQTCFFLERHLSSFEGFLARNQWDLPAVQRCTFTLLQQHLGERLKVHGAYLMGLDTTHTAKQAPKMIGTQKWHHNNNQQGSRIYGHHWAIGGLIAPLASRICFPLSMRLISGNRNPCGFVSTSQGLRRLDFWDSALGCVRDMKHVVQAPLRVVADAYFSKAPFIKPLLSEKVHLISRWRNDGVAWGVPVYGGIGRPPKRGKQYKLANLNQHFPLESVQVTLYGRLRTLQVVCQDLFLRDIEPLIRIVVIQARQPLILICTDLSLSARQIIEMYGYRMAIELTIRELKQALGLGDYQSSTTIAFHRFVHLCCTAFCIFKLMALEHPDWLSVDGSSQDTVPLSLRRVARALRAYLMRQLIFAHSAPQAESDKLEAQLNKLLRIAA